MAFFRELVMDGRWEEAELFIEVSECGVQDRQGMQLLGWMLVGYLHHQHVFIHSLPFSDDEVEVGLRTR